MKNQFTRLIGTFCVSIFMLLISTMDVAAQYCTSSATDIDDAWMTNVNFAGIDNNSGASLYSDFTSVSGTVVPGGSYTFTTTVSFGGTTFTEKAGFWIDWDQNEVFDNDEFYQTATCNTEGCNLTVDVEVPIDATPGETRMRVQLRFGANPTFNPCGTFTYDEVEDYTINISSGECTPPSLTYDVVNNCENDTYALTVHVNDLGSSSSATLFHKRSDGVPVNNTNLNQFLIGQTLTISNSIPFGVTVRDSIVSGNPVCTLIRNFEEDICPAENDEICDAVSMVCGDTLAAMPFIGATQSIDDACFGSGIADVWYTFTSDGSEKYRFAEISTSDIVMSVYTGTDCNDVTEYLPCQDSETLTISEAGTYFVRVRPYSTAQFHTVIVECIPFDCPELSADNGTSCDDGNPNSYNDVLVDCECVGHIPEPGEICQLPLDINSLPYTTTDNTVNYLDDYTFTTATFPPLVPGAIVGPGSSASAYLYMGGDDVVYSYTAPETQSLDISLTDHGTWPGLFVFSGCPFTSTLAYATTTGTAELNINGLVIEEGQTIYIVLSTFPSPQAIAYTLNISSVAFDCPSIQANFGTPCDDGDPNTSNDEINESCECEGIPIPVNDEACTATALACGDSLADQNFIGATASIDDECFGSGTGDIWYSFTAAGGNAYVLSETSSSDIVGSLYSADDCNNLTQIGVCLDTPESYTVTEPGNYYVRIRPYSTATSATVSLQCYEIPENDQCSDAVAITCGETYTGSTFGSAAYPTGQPFCTTSAPTAGNGGVWYSLTPTSDVDVILDLSGSDFDTKIFLYSGSCETPVCIAGDDDGGEGTQSLLEATLTANETYLIYVTGYAGNRGNFVFNISCVNLECSPTISSLAIVDQAGNPIDGCVEVGDDYYVQVTLEGGTGAGFNVSVNGGAPTVILPNGSGIVGPGVSPNTANISVVGVNDPSCSAQGSIAVVGCPPSYDVPCSAVPLLTDGVAIGPYTNENAGFDPGEPLSNGTGVLYHTVWFEVDVPVDVSRLSITTCNTGTSFDTKLSAFSFDDCSDYSSYALLAYNDDQPGGCANATNASYIEFCVEPGSTILVQVDGFAGASGDIFISAAPVADDAICECVLPTASLQSYPVCDGETPSFSVDVIIEDLGSSDFVTVAYTLNGEAVVVDNVTEDFTIEGIPLGTNFTVTLTPSDEACEDYGVLTGTVIQGTDACDPDCLGVPGGSAQPGTPCDANGNPGTYDINCDCIALPDNDLCSDAISLECGETISGNTTGATVATGLATCVTSLNTAPGVWYSITGISGPVSATTCSEGGPAFDTKIGVFSGSCDALVCVTGNDDAPTGATELDCTIGDVTFNRASYVAFEADPSVTYYIYVTGFSANSGPFDLTVNCVNNDVATLTGSVSNWANACGGRAATVNLYEPGTATLVASYNTTVAGDGTFLVDEVEMGTFDVIVKVAGYLAKGTQDVVIASGDNNLALGAIKFGDFNGNNTVDIFDISTFSVAFGTQTGNPGYNPLADYNCDGVVVLFDVSAINQTYINGAVSGDAAPL